VSNSDGYDYTFVCWWYKGYPVYSTALEFEMTGNLWVAAQYEKASAATSSDSANTKEEASSP